MRLGNLDSRSVVVARAFFHATTKHSDDDEDILPQEDSLDVKLSVYGLFSELFPEHVVSKECGAITGKTGLTRLQFNKLGYEMYVKEQSRRVPAPRAKPGNPGYGFRRAKWRNVSDGAEDQGTMQETLQAIGIPRARCDYVRLRVDQTRVAWEQARRPSRPAGPGRPRGRVRGDKADAETPEHPSTLADSFAALYPGLTDAQRSHAFASAVSSAMSTDAAALKFAQQAEQVALLRSAFERAQQPGLNAKIVTGLLAPQQPLAAIQHLLPPVSGGMAGLVLKGGAGSGGHQLGRQHLSLAALNIGGQPFTPGSQTPLQLLGGGSATRVPAGEIGVSEQGQLAEGQLRGLGALGAMQHLAELAAGMRMVGGGTGLGGKRDWSGSMEASSFSGALWRQQPKQDQGKQKVLTDMPLSGKRESGKRKQVEDNGFSDTGQDESADEDGDDGPSEEGQGLGKSTASGQRGKARKLRRAGSLPSLRDDEEEADSPGRGGQEPRNKRKEDVTKRCKTLKSSEGVSGLPSSLPSSSTGRQAAVKWEDPALTKGAISSVPNDVHQKVELVPPQQANPSSHVQLPSVESWLSRCEKLDKLQILGEISLMAAKIDNGCAGGGGASTCAGLSSASTSVTASPPAVTLDRAGLVEGQDTISAAGACKNKAALKNLLTG